ncbi:MULTISPECIES: hypothetical protein [Marinomonas]|uniref:Uncharacterized protein n=1 Tax=Marinomonas arctica TaxID=383750 RepID=A0A7H1JBA1_9GAMM|nr:MULTISPECIES: hypothetical protein [Marinomonas]MCS7485472.1 hypothetical protein [Marinomonas sp. BSi20414]QNT07767.1 hypothetical protein IBG28_09295 [Marinomonas arctica]GGN25356.1 hypothetical protein GCM10011350_15050 [Marinomonas arctica]
MLRFSAKKSLQQIENKAGTLSLNFTPKRNYHYEMLSGKWIKTGDTKIPNTMSHMSKESLNKHFHSHGQKHGGFTAADDWSISQQQHLNRTLVGNQSTLNTSINVGRITSVTRSNDITTVHANDVTTTSLDKHNQQWMKQPKLESHKKFAKAKFEEQKNYHLKGID